MRTRQYWLDLFSGTTWQEFIDHGANITGFRESRWKTVQQIQPDDLLLCYLTGVSRFIGVLRVTSEAFFDDTPIWKDEKFPCRLNVEPTIALTPETAVPILELRDELSIFENLRNPNAWNGQLRGSPTRWKSADGNIILQRLEEAKRNPTNRPVDKRKLGRKPPILNTNEGMVTVPEPIVEEQQPRLVTRRASQEDSDHTEIQYLLLKLGSDMGYEVWVARNDRNRMFDGKTLSESIKLRGSLPVQFNEATTRTIEYIDVLWLRGNSIVAAFEVESTTSIYSGLLRMSDLIAMQPNLNIPLYLVAPEERRNKVIEEVNRPTFARLSTPLSEICQYISFATLRTKLEQVGPFVRYLKHDFISELAEVCALGDS